MIAVIIAGGSGTRLWPLSTKDYPKHLLSLTGDRSLLQNTFDRVKDLADEVFVVTEKSHSKFVHGQLPEIPRKRILSEPGRRGTASCLILALSEIGRQGLDEQPILFFWADHIIQDRRAFSKTVKSAGDLAEKEQKLVFIGIEPTYASTGLGYIQKGKKIGDKFYELKQFVEKPDKKTADKYFKSGEYLWNTGYLLGTKSTFEREIRDHAPRLWNDYHQLTKSLLPLTRKKTYLGFVSDAIDYALSEHLPDALAVSATFDWADVGSFKDLHGLSKQDDTGNHISGENIELENVSNSYVRNDTEMPVAVIGVNDVAVIATENGVLVTNKAQAQKVGEISKKIQKRDKDLKWYEKLQI